LGSKKVVATSLQTLVSPTLKREQLKARLVLQIYRLIKSRRITQAEAGEILGIGQPHVPGLMRGQSGNVSVERLMDFSPPSARMSKSPSGPPAERTATCHSL
jgi:hypothetical protein